MAVCGVAEASVAGNDGDLVRLDPGPDQFVARPVCRRVIMELRHDRVLCHPSLSVSRRSRSIDAVAVVVGSAELPSGERDFPHQRRPQRKVAQRSDETDVFPTSGPRASPFYAQLSAQHSPATGPWYR